MGPSSPRAATRIMFKTMSFSVEEHTPDITVHITDSTSHIRVVKCSGTPDKGPSEIGMTSLQRTLVAAPC